MHSEAIRKYEELLKSAPVRGCTLLEERKDVGDHKEVRTSWFWCSGDVLTVIAGGPNNLVTIQRLPLEIPSVRVMPK